MLSRLRKAARELVAPSAATARRTAAPAQVALQAPGPVEETFDSACPPGPILHIDRCPVCGATEATPVCRYNKFITYEQIPDASCTRYDYALCHECGIVYATRRPSGERYDWLLEHFEETIGRTALGERRAGKLTLSSYALTEDMREQLKRLAARGVFVSDHSGISRKDFLPALLVDRLANSVHVEILGSLIPLKQARVLEIRSRLGGISAALKRLYDADCSALTLFENQQYLIQEVYGIPARCPIDFDEFSIPFEGQFDLIVAKHMFTHAVHPRDFLATVRAHLRPGGHLYLYSEFVEAEFLEETHSMFNTMNPFHMQTFNTASAVRALEANGFHMVFCTMVDGHLAGLAKMMDEFPSDWQRMTDDERKRRRWRYRVASDLAVLQLPEQVRGRVADQWDGALERALANGTAEILKNGRIKVRPLKESRAAKK
jgi:cyclopropane fatty-acyl-phospholipid synthase-like methyltransferase